MMSLMGIETFQIRTIFQPNVRPHCQRESVFKQIKDTSNKQTKLLEFGLPVGGGEGELCNWIRE